jgi:hypothetical protein
MPMPRTIEDQLQEFLAWQAEARREKKTIEAVYDAVKRVEDKQDKMLVALERSVTDRLADHDRANQHGRAIKGLQSAVETLSDAVEAVPNWRASKSEISGHHDIESIKKQIAERDKEQREEATWWRRQRWLWMAAVVTAGCGILASGCLAYTMKRIEALEKTMQRQEHSSR